VPANLHQAEARLHRIGQKGSVLSIYPVVEDSLEAYMMNSVGYKLEKIGRAIDGE